MKKVLKWLFIGFAALFVIYLIDTGGGTFAKKNKDWHKGRMLNKSTIAEWKTATYTDRLATSGGMLAIYRTNKYMPYANDEEWKSNANALVECIDEAAKAPDADKETVAAIASMCISLGKY